MKSIEVLSRFRQAPRGLPVAFSYGSLRTHLSALLYARLRVIAPVRERTFEDLTLHELLGATDGRLHPAVTSLRRARSVTSTTAELIAGVILECVTR